MNLLVWALVVGCFGPKSGPDSNWASPAAHPNRGEAAGAPAVAPADAVRAQESERVLVVCNTTSPHGLAIARYYMERRQVPEGNLVQLKCTTKDNVSEDEFEAKIAAPIRAAVASAKGKYDYIVLTKGVPIRIKDDYGFSVDSRLAGLHRKMPGPNSALNEVIANPYYGKAERFSSQKFGIYLVTRLDGYELSQCKRLVDLSLQATARKGPFVFDGAENCKSGGYLRLQQTMQRAAQALSARGFEALYDDGPTYLSPPTPLMGYVGWGSNDRDFDVAKYRRLRFQPGAIGETFVSTSARRLDREGGGNQSLIGDLIEAGITGIKGYVSEPFTDALANVEILFDRYTRGFNLAESFYMASRVIMWKDIVIGDPLCNPYRSR